MKKIKRAIAVMLAMLMTIQLIACGNSTETKDEGTEENKITVCLPRNEMDSTGYIEGKTREFEEQTGIEVELINTSWDNTADLVTKEMSVGGSTYDVVELDNSWVEKFVTNGWVEPLNEYEGCNEIMEGLLPGLVNTFSDTDGNFYGVTWNNDTRFFMYNAQMLEEAGISVPPKTWNELVEDCKILKDKGICEYGLIMSHQGLASVNELTYTIYSFGGEIFDAEGNMVVQEDQKSVEALQFAVDILADGTVNPTAISCEYEAAANVFYAGEAAFYLQAYPSMYATSNDESVSSIVGQAEVAPYTITNSEDTNVCLTLPEAMAIPSASKNKEAAWEYIKFMASEDTNKEQAKEIGTLPIYSSLYSDPELLELYPYWENVGKQSEFSRALPCLEEYSVYADIFLTETQNMLMGSVTAQQAADNTYQQFAEATGE